MYLGKYLIRKRRLENINQKDLAKKLKISAQFIGRIEKGEVGIPHKYVRKWCKIVGADVEKAKRMMMRDYVEKIEKTI